MPAYAKAPAHFAACYEWRRSLSADHQETVLTIADVTARRSNRLKLLYLDWTKVQLKHGSKLSLLSCFAMGR